MKFIGPLFTLFMALVSLAALVTFTLVREPIGMLAGASMFVFSLIVVVRRDWPDFWSKL